MSLYTTSHEHPSVQHHSSHYVPAEYSAVRPPRGEWRDHHSGMGLSSVIRTAENGQAYISQSGFGTPFQSNVISAHPRTRVTSFPHLSYGPAGMHVGESSKPGEYNQPSFNHDQRLAPPHEIRGQGQAIEQAHHSRARSAYSYLQQQQQQHAGPAQVSSYNNSNDETGDDSSDLSTLEDDENEPLEQYTKLEPPVPTVHAAGAATRTGSGEPESDRDVKLQDDTPERPIWQDILARGGQLPPQWPKSDSVPFGTQVIPSRPVANSEKNEHHASPEVVSTGQQRIGRVTRAACERSAEVQNGNISRTADVPICSRSIPTSRSLRNKDSNVTAVSSVRKNSSPVKTPDDCHDDGGHESSPDASTSNDQDDDCSVDAEAETDFDEDQNGQEIGVRDGRPSSSKLPKKKRFDVMFIDYIQAHPESQTFRWSSCGEFLIIVKPDEFRMELNEAKLVHQSLVASLKKQFHNYHFEVYTANSVRLRGTDVREELDIVERHALLLRHPRLHRLGAITPSLRSSGRRVVRSMCRPKPTPKPRCKTSQSVVSKPHAQESETTPEPQDNSSVEQETSAEADGKITKSRTLRSSNKLKTPIEVDDALIDVKEHEADLAVSEDEILSLPPRRSTRTISRKVKEEIMDDTDFTSYETERVKRGRRYASTPFNLVSDEVAFDATPDPTEADEATMRLVRMLKRHRSPDLEPKPKLKAKRHYYQLIKPKLYNKTSSQPRSLKAKGPRRTRQRESSATPEFEASSSHMELESLEPPRKKRKYTFRNRINKKPAIGGEDVITEAPPAESKHSPPAAELPDRVEASLSPQQCPSATQSAADSLAVDSAEPAGDARELPATQETANRKTSPDFTDAQTELRELYRDRSHSLDSHATSLDTSIQRSRSTSTAGTSVYWDIDADVEVFNRQTMAQLCLKDTETYIDIYEDTTDHRTPSSMEMSDNQHAKQTKPDSDFFPEYTFPISSPLIAKAKVKGYRPRQPVSFDLDTVTSDEDEIGFEELYRITPTSPRTMDVGLPLHPIPSNELLGACLPMDHETESQRPFDSSHLLLLEYEHDPQLIKYLSNVDVLHKNLAMEQGASYAAFQPAYGLPWVFHETDNSHYAPDSIVPGSAHLRQTYNHNISMCDAVVDAQGTYAVDTNHAAENSFALQHRVSSAPPAEFRLDPSNATHESVTGIVAVKNM